MKRIISLLVSAVMVTSLIILFPFAANADAIAHGTCGNRVTWALDSEGTLTISGSGDMDNYKLYSPCPGWYSNRENIKKIIVGDDVTSLGTYAFYGCSNLTDVIIGKKVSYIGYYAFAFCNKLKSIAIPDSVQAIGERAFVACQSLTSVNVPDNVNAMGRYVFMSCTELTDVTIGDGLSAIVEGAFSGCSKLTSIVVGANVETIQCYAFYECTSLKSVTIAEKVKNISSSAFEKCEGITDVYYLGGQNEWNEIIIESNNTHLTDATIHYHRISVSGISLDKTTAELTEGKHLQLTAEVTPENAENKNIVWTSSDESIAIVSNGLVTPVGMGDVTITATAEDGGYQTSCIVSVTGMKIESYIVGCCVNLSHPKKSGEVIGALYDKNDILLYTRSFAAADNVLVAFEVPANLDLEGAYIKVFWWNLETVKPISKYRLIGLE